MDRNHAYIPDQDRSARKQQNIALVSVIIISAACIVGFLLSKIAELSERQTNVVTMTFGFVAVLLCGMAYSRGH